MKSIIICAGEGKRLRPITIPKCLLKYKKITLLRRLITQIKKNGGDEIVVVTGYKGDHVAYNIQGIDDVKVIYNNRYKTDTNIYSMYLAMSNIFDDVVIFEGDSIFEDEFVKYALGTDFENKSIWFTSGKFKQGQSGGIFKTDGKGRIIAVNVVDSYNPVYEGYEKMMGVMRISLSQYKKLYKILSMERNIDQYYFTPWARRIDKLFIVKGDAYNYASASFNTADDFKVLEKTNFDFSYTLRDIYLMNVDRLHPIEQYDSARIDMVKEGVINNGSWVVPLRIEKQNNIVLDGHHSLQLAKELGLSQVPVMSFNYDEVDMWSLREELIISKDDVVKNARNNVLYPEKTVKHKFPNVSCRCNVSLEDLK